MKKILVPTDFSVPAENAAKFAIAMAKQLNASVTVLNAYTVPVAVPAADMGVWPVIDYEDLPGQITSELDTLVEKLIKGSCENQDRSACPPVDYRCEMGTVLQVVQKVSDELDVDLQVMGLSGAGGLVNFILGSNSMSMIEKGDRPVLLVPYGASFAGIKKIAYAGSLTPDDIRPLEFLCKLASWLDAEVSVLHVIDMRDDLNEGVQAIGVDLIAQVKTLTGFKGLNYEPVWNGNTDQGLEWIAEQHDIGIVSMLHQRHNFLERIFKGSRTKRFARYTTIPLLVFPPQFIKK